LDTSVTQYLSKGVSMCPLSLHRLVVVVNPDTQASAVGFAADALLLGVDCYGTIRRMD
jgi:hypothetical protein